MNKSVAPNILTSLNLISGSAAAFVAFYDLELSCFLIFLSLIFDFFDGALARLLKAQSGFGKQMDSFADMISFGFSPAVIMYLLILNTENMPVLSIGDIFIAPFVVIILPLFVAFRLATFNIQDQGAGFSGLPSPASAMFLVSLPLIKTSESSFFNELYSLPGNFYFLLAVILIMSAFMVSNIKMIKLSLDFKDLSNSIIEILLLGIFIVFIFLFGYLSIPLIILLYVLFSVFKLKKSPGQVH